MRLLPVRLLYSRGSQEAVWGCVRDAAAPTSSRSSTTACRAKTRARTHTPTENETRELYFPCTNSQVPVGEQRGSTESSAITPHRTNTPKAEHLHGSLSAPGSLYRLRRIPQIRLQSPDPFSSFSIPNHRAPIEIHPLPLTPFPRSPLSPPCPWEFC